MFVCVLFNTETYTDTKHCTDIDILYSKAFYPDKVLNYCGEKITHKKKNVTPLIKHKKIWFSCKQDLLLQTGRLTSGFF